MKKNSKKKIILSIVAAFCAVVLLALAFFAGFWTRGKYGSTSYDWVLSIIKNYYYQDVDTSDADEIALDALVNNYLDIYSAYYTAEEYTALQSENAGKTSGLGIQYSYVEGTGIYVALCFANSPAYIAGIRSGDIIVSAEYDGQTTSFDSSTSFAQFVAALDEGQSAVYHTAEEEAYTVAKAGYTRSYVNFATNQSGWYFSGDDALELTVCEGDAIEYLPDGVGYIALSQFYGDAAEQFKQAVKVLKSQNCTSVILDLRNNGGGSVSVMQQIAGCFESAAGKTAMTAEYKDGSQDTYKASSYSEEYTFSSDVGVYVLANSGTASASEALIGVLVSYGITDYGDIYISEYEENYLQSVNMTAEEAKSGKTYGKGIMQTTFYNYITGEALKLTTAQIYWPDGNTIHEKGLSAADGCKTVSAPAPVAGIGSEFEAAVYQIFGSSN